MQDSQRATPIRIDANRGAGTVTLGWTDGHETVYDTRHAALAVPLRLLPRRGRPARLARHGAHPHARPDPPRRRVHGRRYAIAPLWGDGHHTGYYSFTMLRDRCPCDGLHEGPRAEIARHRTPEELDDHPTAPFVAGYRVAETKGQVFGLVVRSRGLGGNLMAGLRSIGGGEIHEYTSLLEDTRRQAIDRMVQNATLVGANAVISMRFDSLRARRHDVRDRGLRHRRGHRPGRRRAPAATE